MCAGLLIGGGAQRRQPHGQRGQAEEAAGPLNAKARQARIGSRLTVVARAPELTEPAALQCNCVRAGLAEARSCRLHSHERAGHCEGRPTMPRRAGHITHKQRSVGARAAPPPLAHGLPCRSSVHMAGGPVTAAAAWAPGRAQHPTTNNHQTGNITRSLVRAGACDAIERCASLQVRLRSSAQPQK